MAVDPEESLPRKPKMDIVVGEDLSALSLVELESRIAVLEQEIVRTRAAVQARALTKNAADAVFKR